MLKQWRNLFETQKTNHSIQAQEHWKNVEQLGLPPCKHEHWEHTPLERLLAYRFNASNTQPVSVQQRNNLSLDIDAHRLVFIDGRFSKELSDPDTGMWQVTVEYGANRHQLPVPIQPEVFLHLTESLSNEITRIHLPTNKITKIPLYLLHISQGSADQGALSTLHYRHHIEIATGSQGQVIEHFVSLYPKAHFCGTRTTIQVDNNAHFCYIKLAVENNVSYHFSHNDIIIRQNAVVRSSNFILGAGLTRQHTSAQLNGEGSDISINSLLLPSGNDISYINTYLEHNKGYCQSCQLHKIIARNQSKGVFNGFIKVAKHALKTNGEMNNNNLLLDRLAKIYTKPQLEVYADDVKCSHSATAGRINDEQIFYLRSRGIKHKDAQQMIIYAFAAEVTEAISNEIVREIVLARIATCLQGVG